MDTELNNTSWICWLNERPPQSCSKEDVHCRLLVAVVLDKHCCLQSLSRRASGTGEPSLESARDEEMQEKLKSGGATELSVPEFDIAEAVRKAQEATKAAPDEDFVHIEVPPSPPLSPLKSSSEDEEIAPKKQSEELGDPMETEGEFASRTMSSLAVDHWLRQPRLFHRCICLCA